MSVPAALHRLALATFRRLPTKARRLVVRTISPSFTVGAMCVIERGDGAVLLVRHSYRDKWGVPGGLLKRGESKEAGAIRETFEETGLRIELLGQPSVVVDADAQRIDVIFRGRPAPGADTEVVAPRSPEILETRWFGRDELPGLQFETAGALEVLRQARGEPGPE